MRDISKVRCMRYNYKCKTMIERCIDDIKITDYGSECLKYFVLRLQGMEYLELHNKTTTIRYYRLKKLFPAEKSFEPSIT